MIPRLPPARALLCCVLAAPALLTAQANPDVASPKLREKVLADAALVMAKRGVPDALPSPLPNPFLAKGGDENADSAPAASSPSRPASGPAAASAAPSGVVPLAQLAARIPATGVITVGGAPILLAGQKRLRIGDSLAVTLDGQVYELSITAIGSTSFTVRRGDSIHTRPVRQSAP